MREYSDDSIAGTHIFDVDIVVQSSSEGHLTALGHLGKETQ